MGEHKSAHKPKLVMQVYLDLVRGGEHHVAVQLLLLHHHPASAPDHFKGYIHHRE